MIRRAFVAGLLVIGLVAGLAIPSAVVLAQDEGTVVAEGFNGPQGVLVAPDGSVWVIEGGVGGDTAIEMVDPASGQVVEAMMGDTARVVEVTPDGEQNVVAVLPSVHVGEDFVGGARLALLDGKLYATSGEWLGTLGDEALPLMGVVAEIADGEATTVGDVWETERTTNPDGVQVHSHPYDLAVGPDGSLWVADAGANSLFTVDPESGAVEFVATFDAMPGVFPNPNRGGEMLTDPVPTGVAFDADGNAYVSLLSGAPFIPGSAKVVKVDAAGEVSDYATGLTMLTDLTAGPDGNLYAVQFAVFTDQGPTLNSGALVKVAEGEGSTPVVEGLSFPTSVDFNEAGDAYVTINGVGAPGSGAVVMYAGVAAASDAEGAETEEGATTEAAAAATAEPVEEMDAEAEATEEPAEEMAAEATEEPAEEMAAEEMATEEPAEEMAAEQAATEEPAEEAPAPEQLPATGGFATNPVVIAIAGALALLAVVGGVVALRKS